MDLTKLSDEELFWAINPDTQTVLDVGPDIFKVPKPLFNATSRVESSDNQSAVSPKGALGRMQIMPDTATELEIDPANEAQNLMGGLKYLRRMKDAHGTWRNALWAYNAGSRNVNRNIMPTETADYLGKLIKNISPSEAHASTGNDVGSLSDEELAAIAGVDLSKLSNEELLAAAGVQSQVNQSLPTPPPIPVSEGTAPVQSQQKPGLTDVVPGLKWLESPVAPATSLTDRWVRQIPEGIDKGVYQMGKGMLSIPLQLGATANQAVDFVTGGSTTLEDLYTPYWEMLKGIYDSVGTPLGVNGIEAAKERWARDPGGAFTAVASTFYPLMKARSKGPVPSKNIPKSQLIGDNMGLYDDIAPDQPLTPVSKSAAESAKVFIEELERSKVAADSAAAIEASIGRGDMPIVPQAPPAPVGPATEVPQISSMRGLVTGGGEPPIPVVQPNRTQTFNVVGARPDFTVPQAPPAPVDPATSPPVITQTTPAPAPVRPVPTGVDTPIPNHAIKVWNAIDAKRVERGLPPIERPGWVQPKELGPEYIPEVPKAEPIKYPIPKADDPVWHQVPGDELARYYDDLEATNNVGTREQSKVAPTVIETKDGPRLQKAVDDETVAGLRAELDARKNLLKGEEGFVNIGDIIAMAQDLKRQAKEFGVELKSDTEAWIAKIVATGRQSEKTLDATIDKAFLKAIKPSATGKSEFSGFSSYGRRARQAIKDIVANKDTLGLTDDMGEPVNTLPQNLNQFSKAIESRKADVFRQYDAMATKAGERGATVNLNPIVAKLKAEMANKVTRDLAPQTTEYAQWRIESLTESGSYTALEAQEAIKVLNNRLQAFYRNPSYDTASRAYVDSIIADGLRKALDNAIEVKAGAGYQDLKNLYGSLKAIEKDVNRRMIADLKKSNKGLSDFVTDSFLSHQTVKAILLKDPGILLSTGAAKGITSWYKMLNDPNRIVRQLFEDVEDAMKAGDGRTFLRGLKESGKSYVKGSVEEGVDRMKGLNPIYPASYGLGEEEDGNKGN